MPTESEIYIKGDSPMTDYQFKYIMELKDKVAELSNELGSSYGPTGTDDAPGKAVEKPGMTDYQFKQYEVLRDKCESLTREVNQLRVENALIKSENKQLKKNQKVSG